VPSAARREQLMQAASDLVRAGGLSALTMEALAEGAEGPKPTVYRHFANRQAVAVALIDRHFSDIIGYVTRQVSGAMSLEETVTRMLAAPPDFETIRSLPIHGFGSGCSGEAEIDAEFRRHTLIFIDHWRWRLEQRGVTPERARLAAPFLHAMMAEAFRTEGQLQPLPEAERQILTVIILGALRALGAQDCVVAAPDAPDPAQIS
jgi:AcrR family transcriptional regulator